MATSEAKEIKKQETLVRFSIISYKTRLRVVPIKQPGPSQKKMIVGFIYLLAYSVKNKLYYSEVSNKHGVLLILFELTYLVV